MRQGLLWLTCSHGLYVRRYVLSGAGCWRHPALPHGEPWINYIQCPLGILLIVDDDATRTRFLQAFADGACLGLAYERTGAQAVKLAGAR